MNERFLQCLVVAKALVDSYKEPMMEGVVGFDVGGSDSSGNTRFTREGTSQTQKDYTLPNDLSSILQLLYQSGQISPTTSSNELNLLNQMLTRSTTSLPGLASLQSIQGIDPTSFTGQSSLNNMAERNPYSSDYESAVGALYDRSFAKGRAMAQSGPTNVRGGTARQGFEMAELSGDQARNKFREVRGQQDKEAGVVQGAVQLMNTIESMRRGSQMQAQQQNMAGETARSGQSLQAAGGVNDLRRANASTVGLAGEMLGKPRQVTTDNLRGRGSQSASSSNWGAGLTCCFIFAEGLNGRLPWYVRRGRDDFNTPLRRLGYLLMASWLVPLMARSPSVSEAVNRLMIRPFLIVGRWWYENRKGWKGPVLKPWCWAWFWTWSLIGFTYGKLLRKTVVPTVRTKWEI